VPSQLPPAPQTEVLRLFDDADWSTILRAMMVAAMRVTGKNRSAAEDACQSAYASVRSRALGGKGKRWDPARHPNLQLFMICAVYSEAIDAHRVNRRFWFMDESAESRLTTATTDPARMLAHNARTQRGLEIIADAAAKLDVQGRALLEDVVAGTFEPLEFGDRFALSTAEVNATRQRVKYHLRVLIDADPDRPSRPSPEAMVAATAARMAGAGDDEGEDS